MNPLQQLLKSEETKGQVALKIVGLEAMALESFRRLSQCDQTRVVAALHDGAEPGSCEFVWTALVHAGIARLALLDVNEPRAMPDDLFHGAQNDVGRAFPGAPSCGTETPARTTDATATT